MKVKDIIKEDKFNEFLSYELEAYNKRPQPEEGRRYRRTPFDSLKDEGKFNIQSIRDEFAKIATGKSQLPKAQRDAITALIFKVAQTVVNYKAAHEKAAQTAKETIEKVTKKVKL
jgi:hypothetical protein